MKYATILLVLVVGIAIIFAGCTAPSSPADPATPVPTSAETPVIPTPLSCTFRCPGLPGECSVPGSHSQARVLQ